MISDGRGGTATGTVNVTVAPSAGSGSGSPTLNISSVTITPGVGAAIQAAGIPGRTYVVESTDSLNGSWVARSGPIVASPTGGVSFTDPLTPPPAMGQRFYRVVETN